MAFNPIRPRSLRGQLVGLVAALAIPLVALQVWWGFREAQSAEDAVAAEALAIAEATASNVRQFFTQAEAALTGASADFGLQLVSGVSCDDTMQTLVDLLPYLTDVTTVNRDGSMACSARTVPEGTSAAASGWFPEMAGAEDPKYAIDTPVLGTMSGLWILPLIAPIVDEEGSFAGAIAGSLPLLGFARLMSGDREDPNLLVTIATEERVVVARSENPEDWVGQPLPPIQGTEEVVEPGR